jgi:hypothetical protein
VATSSNVSDCGLLLLVLTLASRLSLHQTLPKNVAINEDIIHVHPGMTASARRTSGTIKA